MKDQPAQAVEVRQDRLTVRERLAALMPTLDLTWPQEMQDLWHQWCAQLMAPEPAPAPGGADHKDCMRYGCQYGHETGAWPHRVCPEGECQHARRDAEPADRAAGVEPIGKLYRDVQGQVLIDPIGDIHVIDGMPVFSEAALVDASSRVDELEREARRLREEPDLLQVLDEECWDLRQVSISHGDDASTLWTVVGFWMAKPQERTLGYGITPKDAIRDAIKEPDDPTRWGHDPEALATEGAGSCKAILDRSTAEDSSVVREEGAGVDQQDTIRP